jgi:hypothetical protein
MVSSVTIFYDDLYSAQVVKDEARISIWCGVRCVGPESKGAQDRGHERREIRNLVEHGAVRAIGHRVEGNFKFDCSVHRKHRLNHNGNKCGVIHVMVGIHKTGIS